MTAALKPAHWFACAVLIRQRFEGKPDEAPLFELRVLLLQASDETEAADRAEKLAQASREEYENADGETVVWEFQEVFAVKQLPDDEITDGSEVWWDFLDQRGLDELRRTLD